MYFSISIISVYPLPEPDVSCDTVDTDDGQRI
jgi:hypothetical protein